MIKNIELKWMYFNPRKQLIRGLLKLLTPDEYKPVYKWAKPSKLEFSEENVSNFESDISSAM